jgi:hypothetical protein
MDGETEFLLPALAGLDGVLKVVRDLLPGFEDLSIRPLNHDSLGPFLTFGKKFEFSIRGNDSWPCCSENVH